MVSLVLQLLASLIYVTLLNINGSTLFWPIPLCTAGTELKIGPLVIILKENLYKNKIYYNNTKPIFYNIT